MIDAVSNISVTAGATQKPVTQANVPAPSAPQSSQPEYRPSASGTAYVRVDNLLNLAIIEYRSSETGDVLHQYPTEAQIQAFSRAAEADARPAPEPVAADTASVDTAPVSTGAAGGGDARVAETSAEAAPAAAVNVTADGGSVPAYTSSTQVVTA